MEQRKIAIIRQPVEASVSVPGSKSVTNRALLLAALADGVSTLHGVQFSDDSRHFLDSLISLGFEVTIEEENRTVTIRGLGGRIPKKEATIDVGSAGTAARFMTTMLAFSDGEYRIHCSEQMSKRPMRPLFEALQEAGAEICSATANEVPQHLPVIIRGCAYPRNTVTMDISQSTQFLSALLLTAPMLRDGLKIRITSEKKTGSYIRITRNMLGDWGIETAMEGDTYIVPAGSRLRCGTYEIEPDVSGACYFYAIAAITGSCITVRGVHRGLMQGDMKFLDVLEQMGCEVRDLPEGIQVCGPEDKVLHGITLNMNDFSDQALTLAAIAPFADTPTTIRGIGHIRGQECDRLHAMEVNLHELGVQCEATEDSITITPGAMHGGVIRTFEDHRVAMAFSVLGCVVDDVIIENPMCCRKTFENYFEVLDSISEM